MSDSKIADTDHPVHKLIARRWSPYAFASKSVPVADLQSLFEAARWAASSFNEQPWRYVVARKEESSEFERLLSCLMDANQEWARHVPVLALGVMKLAFSQNNKPNRVSLHDLGLASANLTFEATARGLVVHQMAGIVPARARQVFGIPEGFEAATALAIGYPGRAEDLPETLRARDLTERSRRPLRETVFAGAWDRPAFK